MGEANISHISELTSDLVLAPNTSVEVIDAFPFKILKDSLIILQDLPLINFKGFGIKRKTCAVNGLENKTNNVKPATENK